MARRRRCFGSRSALLLAASASLLFTACSSSTRYRVLKFFFDGVPDPNAPAPAALAEATTDEEAEAEQSDRDQRKATLVAYAHPLYRADRCGECHDMLGGGLVRTVEEGLCTMCHMQPSIETKFVHEPVAKNECLSCHHYHASSNPKILLEDANLICFRCHNSDDLSPDAHRATIGDRTCLDCHDPHGGADLHLLKASEQ